MKDEEFEAALKAIDIEAYLDANGIDYRHSHGTRGLQLNLRECPVCHGEGFKTYINAEEGLGNCFHGACGQKFNRFWLFKAVSGLAGREFTEHIKATAANLGWLPKKARVTIERAELQLPSKVFALPHEGSNLAYLDGRGITAATAKHFDLGFCLGGWWGYTLADGTQKWMSFNDRVIVPIRDLSGTLVSFQGRDITGKQEPKYLFPPGYAVAGAHLYNGHNFKDGLTTHVIVGEGAFDVFSIHQALQRASMSQVLPIATFGMHLSAGPDGQIAKFGELKARGLKSVTFMWDGEKKATKAAVTAGLQLLGLGLRVNIARLPRDLDPNEVDFRTLLRAFVQAVPLTRLTAITLAAEA